MAAQPLPPARPGERPLTMREQAQRTEAMRCLIASTLPCSMHVNIGIFFDGTNNNRQRDQLDIKDPNKRYHSNVVVLHDSYKEDEPNNFYRHYVPGVGTPFAEIGETTETADGKSKALGGDARINWALIQVLNSISLSICRSRLISDPGKGAKTFPLYAGSYVPSNNLEGKRNYLTGKLGELRTKLKQQLPKRIVQVNLSVFGFSRGAAQARAFCHFLHHCMLQPEGGAYTLAGIPTRVQFLGLFDSVASVGLAAGSGVFHGFGGWANGTMDIAPSVERTVHMVAAHEIRINFPLSTGRIGDKYPGNCHEIVYPGAHSDVGGGYGAGDQGKAVGSRSKLLSQMPLLEMYHQARASGVPLLTTDELTKVPGGSSVISDLELDNRSTQLFNAYRDLAATRVPGGKVEDHLKGHIELYWNWRVNHLGRYDQLPSAALASPQERTDMQESDGDFASDIDKALHPPMVQPMTVGMAMPAPPRPMPLDEAQKAFLAKRAVLQRPLPESVDRFFDQLVHDSHASFYMVGPVTESDRREKIAQIKEKIESARRLMGMAAQIGTPVGQAAPPKPVSEDDALWSLSDLERRIWANYRKNNPQAKPATPGVKDDVSFPPLTDADREQLLAMEGFSTRGPVRLVTRSTRRELGGHLRYRRVFSES